MKIGNISTVTKTYLSTKGNEFTIVSLELLEIPEDRKDFYKPRMCGTISHKHIDGNGKLNRVLNLASLCIGQTVDDAIQSRENVEEIAGMTEAEIIEHFKAKFALETR